MLTSWANHAALVAFGFTIGSLGYVQQMLTPIWVRGNLSDRSTRKPGENFLTQIFRENRAQTDRLAEARRRSPALRWVSNALIALIAVLIAMIVLSPVEVEWWWLLGSIAAGGAFAATVAWLARSGRLGSVATRDSGRFNLSAFSRAVVVEPAPGDTDPPSTGPGVG